MVTIGMNYKILPGKEEIFEGAFKKVVELMGTMEGHTKTNMYRDISDQQCYLIVSEWSSEEAYRGFINSDKFGDVVDWGKEHILAGRPSHTTYQH
ncbi:MAG: antibiotic biosynthesis monooxygenase [Nitrospina sp.]|nr:antibiotic biosynthesis monooxygenase [Nitrospina sp.]